MAASALWNLEQRTGRPVVADTLILASDSSVTVNSLGPGRLLKDGFLGAHLRVEADAEFAKFPGYQSQAPFYLEEAQRLNLTTIYLATGSPEHRERFQKDARALGITVYVKEDLLEPEELAVLKSLTWDQQALVDYDVLLYSCRFCGAVRSSFSWLIVADRTTLPEAEYSRIQGSIAANSIMRGRKDGRYVDGLSSIVGKWESTRPPVGTWPM
jgi:hypothetical protein